MFVFLALFLTGIGMIFWFPSYALFGWCWKRGWRLLCVLGLAALGAGITYGILRFTGIILFPSDKYPTTTFFDAPFQEDGFYRIYFCGAPFLGAVAALVKEQKQARRAAAAEKEAE